MKCQGCTVLGRQNCGETCILRSCLHWIKSPQEQANAVVFLGNYFGPDHFIALLSAVPEDQRKTVVRTLLLEACGRLLSPVDGVVGMLARKKFEECKKAVDMVLAGGTVTPIPYQPLALSPVTTNQSSGSSSEIKTLDLFK